MSEKQEIGTIVQWQGLNQINDNIIFIRYRNKITDDGATISELFLTRGNQLSGELHDLIDKIAHHYFGRFNYENEEIEVFYGGDSKSNYDEAFAYICQIVSIIYGLMDYGEEFSGKFIN